MSLHQQETLNLKPFIFLSQPTFKLQQMYLTRRQLIWNTDRVIKMREKLPGQSEYIIHKAIGRVPIKKLLLIDRDENI